MTEPVVVSNVFTGLKTQLVETNLSALINGTEKPINARIFRREVIPPHVTYPFLSIQELEATKILSGDAGEVINLSQMWQISVWQESITAYDTTLPGKVARSLKGIPLFVNGQRAQTRFVSIVRVPSPDDEIAVQHAITLSVFLPLDAI